MGGKGSSIGHPQPRPCSGGNTLKRCMNNGKTDDVVLIDLDSDNFQNVIILDVPESLSKKLRSTNTQKNDKKGPFRTIIHIDDDEGTDNEHPEIGVKGDGTFPRDASSSSMRSCPTSNHSRNSLDAFGDRCHFDHENKSPVKLSKCKRTYSGKASSRNLCGLRTESKSGSDNDCLDCEFMEDSSGKLREQWEKASLKRKYDTHNGQSSRGDYANASRFCADKANYEQEDRSPFVAMDDGNLGSSSKNFKKTTSADFLLQSMLKTQNRHNKTDAPHRADPLMEDPSCTYTEVPNHQKFEHGGSLFRNEEEQGPAGPPLCPINVLGTKQVKHDHKYFCDKERTPQADAYLSKCESNGDKKTFHGKASLADEEAPLCDGQHSVETEVDTCNKDERFHKTSCNSHFPKESSTHGGIEENSNSMSIDSSFRNSPMSNEAHVNHGVSAFIDKVRGSPAECFFCKNLSLGKSGISVEKGCPQENGEPVIEEPTLCNCDINDGQLKQGESQTVEAEKEFSESMSNGKHKDEKDNLLYDQGGDVTHVVQSCIINEREKLKETDEYKRAIEEEWASRQKELQIQAEATQQLRQLWRRRKAESVRLLDMERRQKQRVEEMRETQKKDEENMNLKEQVRAEIRKELNNLEISCHDMASLLRGLGIHMDGALVPLPHEVRAAYKRALLTFHPDRASRSDIRQLVEAEEKFKLISRMKEKFLSTS